MDAVFTASLALPLFYLAFLYVYNIINVLFLSPIGRIPGDKLVIWNWLANMPKVVSGSLIFDLARQHRTHNSPIIFITADMISIADAKLAREILLNKDLPKSRLYDMLVQIHVNLFSTRDKVYHKTLRRLISPAFGLSFLNSLMPMLIDCCASLESKLDECIEEEETVINVWDLMSRLTLDFIGKTAFNLDFRMIESFHPSGSASVNSGNTLPAAINRNLKYVGSTNNPLLYWVRYINFLPWTRRWKQDQQFLRDTVSKLLEDKRAEISTSESSTVKGQYSDILHLLLESKDDLVEDGGKSTGLNDLEILSNSVMFVIAGSDTTSNTLGFLMIELCENPQYMAQLVAEIRKLPIDKSTGRIDASFLKSGSTSCKFLDACVYETLRLHPVAPAVARETDRGMIFSPGKGIRDAEQGEFPLAGEYLIPKGTQLAVNIVAMNRDLGIWGEDADVFNPSRMEALKPEHDVIAFSLGSRNCVGKNFAWMEIRYVVANLLTSFEVFKLQDKMQDLSESAHFTLKLKSDSYLVHIRRRTIDK